MDDMLTAEALYNIAMSVGIGLDLQKSLHSVLREMVRALNGSLGMILLVQWENDRIVGVNRMCVFPDDATDSRDCREATEIAKDVLLGQTRRSAALLKPTHDSLSSGATGHRFLLPGHGLLVLCCHDAPLSAADVAALNPICRKIGQSIDNSLQFQHVQSALAARNAQYQTSTEMIEGFLSAVSHELRTPLTLIMGFIETLLDGRPGPLTTTQKRFLENSYKSSDRMLALIDELLTVTQLQYGQVQLEKHLFNPSHIVASLREKINGLATEKAIILSIENNWATRNLCYGDQHWVEDAIIQLTENAMKFTPATGKVQVRSYFRDDAWVFCVTDAGPGIPEKELPFVFDRFYRGRRAKSEQYPGVGVGLCVVKAVIDAHGGEVGIKNNPEGGVTAWFKLAVAPAE